MMQNIIIALITAFACPFLNNINHRSHRWNAACLGFASALLTMPIPSLSSKVPNRSSHTPSGDDNKLEIQKSQVSVRTFQEASRGDLGIFKSLSS